MGIRIVPFQSDTKPVDLKSTKKREWVKGGTVVNELCEYKNLGVLKIYICWLVLL